jgi:hypothetical protein
MKLRNLGLALAIAAISPLAMAGVAAPGDFTTITGSGDLNVGAGKFFVDVSDSKVGIGMTNPSRDFHLRWFSAGNVDFLHQNNGAGGARFIVQSAARQWIWTALADGNYSLFGTNGAGNAFVVDANGNVGIKDGTPDSELSIAGDLTVNGTDMTIIGGVINAGDITSSGTMSAAIVEIRGAGNDLAESFKVNAPIDQVKAGMVVSIDPKNAGEMMLATTPHDRKVAGIINGAGGLHAGIHLGDTHDGTDGFQQVALTGRVWCLVDTAVAGAVVAGDSLTTSSTPGHAMKVVDYSMASGSIIGKAMTNLESGKGLVLVLVNLN